MSDVTFGNVSLVRCSGGHRRVFPTIPCRREAMIGRAGDTAPKTWLPYCHDCGLVHGSMLDVFACDIRVGRCTPGLSDTERAGLILKGTGTK